VVIPDKMRVSDAEREAVQARLRAAQAEGRLTLTEFDSRVQTVWQAATRGDLAKVTADLPKPVPVKAAPTKATGGATLWFRIVVTAWLSVSALNLALWASVSVTVGPVYPWFLWVFVPWGVVLASLWFAGIGRRRR
jgi:hypothetical protein